MEIEWTIRRNRITSLIFFVTATVLQITDNNTFGVVFLGILLGTLFQVNADSLRVKQIQIQKIESLLKHLEEK